MDELSKEKYIELASRGNIIPVYREILADMDTPVSAYKKLGKGPSFLLESLEGGEKWARYSFLGVRPSKIIKGVGSRLELITPGGATERIESANPLQYLRDYMSSMRPVEAEGLPRFYGGLVGYMGYDMVRYMESLPDENPPAVPMPDLFFMLADTMLIFDNLRQTIKVVRNVHTGEPGASYESAIADIDGIIAELRRPREESRPSTKPVDEEFVSSFGAQGDFEAAVLRAKEYILSGDIFQVVLSQRFGRRTSANAFDIYRALRVINPSPYMYFINTGEGEIIGSSPEILVRLEEGNVTLRPIAGTRRRGYDEAEDMALEAELKADPKEVAEHIMLLDLGRNDVGRVARIGSVKVTSRMSIERYSHVMHMVSNVEGELAEGLDFFDVLNATFPAGTVTGAPKIRAMEIIEELEPHRRGAYAGAVGYFSYSGNMDTCITIRTIIKKDDMVYVQSGAGVVADSEPRLEHMETMNKARGMKRAIEMAERGLQ